MGDLSDGSQQWWEEMVQAAKKWYIADQEKSPLEKVKHKPQVPLDLQHPRYRRLEKRVTALLMGAQQEEVVASKEVTAINVLARLMTCYQPGGLSEKGAILSALTHLRRLWVSLRL